MNLRSLDLPRQPKIAAIYGRQVFEAILAIGQTSYGELWPLLLELRSDGAWIVTTGVDDDGRYFDAVGFHLGWTPAIELEGVDPLEAPALRFPFTANELAAWFVDGVGAFFLEGLGGIDDGPDQSELPPAAGRLRTVREAIEGAIEALKLAQHNIGPRPDTFDVGPGNASASEEDVRRQRCADELRQHRGGEGSAVQSEWQLWRKAVVRLLLRQSEMPIASAPHFSKVKTERMQQEDVMLEVLKAGGYDPLDLPGFTNGRKSEVLDFLRRGNHFTEATRTKILQRLRKDGRIGGGGPKPKV